MKVVSLLKFIALLTLLFVIVFLLILFQVDPFSSGKPSLIYFMITFFFTLAGVLVFPGYYVRLLVYRDKTATANFAVSLRQAILISIGVVGLLILKAMGSLTWWDGLLLIAALVFLELFFRG